MNAVRKLKPTASLTPIADALNLLGAHTADTRPQGDLDMPTPVSVPAPAPVKRNQQSFFNKLIRGKVLHETGYDQLERFLFTLRDEAKTHRYIIMHETQVRGATHLGGYVWMANEQWRDLVMKRLFEEDTVSEPIFDAPDELGRWSFFARSVYAIPKVSTMSLSEYTPET